MTDPPTRKDQVWMIGIADNPRKRQMRKDKEKLVKVTFNTARDSLMWYRHASEMVFSGTCRANQTDICAALKFGYRNATERALQEVAAVNLQNTLSTIGCYLCMAAALEPVIGEGVRVRRETLDDIM